MLGAAVPEASINKHRDLPTREDEVRLAAEFAERLAVRKEPETAAMEFAPKRHLRARILSAVAAHHG
jgi:hypothetical protein